MSTQSRSVFNGISRFPRSPLAQLVGEAFSLPRVTALTAVAALAMNASAQAESFPARINVSDLDGSNGFAILEGAGVSAGSSVSTAGDFNGDGFADIIIADSYGDVTAYDPFPYAYNGVAYVR